MRAMPQPRALRVNPEPRGRKSALRLGGCYACASAVIDMERVLGMLASVGRVLANPDLEAWASAMVEAEASLSSVTRRSWNVPAARCARRRPTRTPGAAASNEQLQGRGNACQGISQPIREPCGVGREVGVVTVEDAQLREQLVVAGVEPVHLTAPGAAGVGEHEGVATVGLGLARVEVGGAAHHQSGHVRNRDVSASGDREHEARERAGLVHDQRRGPEACGAIEQGLYVRLVVGDGSGEERRARGVEHVGEVLRLPDVEADPHIDVVGHTHCGSPVPHRR